MTPADFPILRAAARSTKRFDDAIQDLDEAQQAGAIRNAVLVDVKFVLGNVVDDAWTAHVKRPFFYGRWDENPGELRDLNDSLSVMGLHSMKSVAKRVLASAIQDPAVDAMRAFVAEVAPLQELVASFKGDRLLMGRAPNTNPAKPVNPDKIVKTCACCYRQIAIAGDGLSHHGYRRPGEGYQTPSCPGIRFKPLERSSEGLAWVILIDTQRWIDRCAVYARRDSMATLTIPGQRRHDPPVTIDRTSTRWSHEFHVWKTNLESEIHWASSRLRGRHADLARWDARRVSEPYVLPGGVPLPAPPAPDNGEEETDLEAMRP